MQKDNDTITIGGRAKIYLLQIVRDSAFNKSRYSTVNPTYGITCIGKQSTKNLHSDIRACPPPSPRMKGRMYKCKLASGKAQHATGKTTCLVTADGCSTNITGSSIQKSHGEKHSTERRDTQRGVAWENGGSS